METNKRIRRMPPPALPAIPGDPRMPRSPTVPVAIPKAGLQGGSFAHLAGGPASPDFDARLDQRFCRAVSAHVHASFGWLAEKAGCLIDVTAGRSGGHVLSLLDRAIALISNPDTHLHGGVAQLPVNRPSTFRPDGGHSPIAELMIRLVDDDLLFRVVDAVQETARDHLGSNQPEALMPPACSAASLRAQRTVLQAEIGCLLQGILNQPSGYDMLMLWARCVISARPDHLTPTMTNLINTFVLLAHGLTLGQKCDPERLNNVSELFGLIAAVDRSELLISAMLLACDDKLNIEEKRYILVLLKLFQAEPDPAVAEPDYVLVLTADRICQQCRELHPRLRQELSRHPPLVERLQVEISAIGRELEQVLAAGPSAWQTLRRVMGGMVERLQAALLPPEGDPDLILMRC